MDVPRLTAAQRMQLRSALGPDVLRAAERLQQSFETDGRAPAFLWRELLQVLHRQHADVMESPMGQLISVAVLGRIGRERGAGFPNGSIGSALRPRG